jgi:hypothetical protein
MTFVVDGTNGLTFNDATTQSSTATNASNISSGTLGKARLPTGSVLQVVSATKTDTWSEAQSSNSISGSNVTGLTATITPTSTSSKILILVNLNMASTAPQSVYNSLGFVIYRAGTAIAIGDSAGTRARVTASATVVSNFQLIPMSMSYLDSPSTTSSTAYSIRLWNGGGGTYSMYVNLTDNDSNSGQYTRSASTVTVMEIAA